MYIIEKERNVYTTVKTTEGSFAHSSLKPKYGPGVKRNREGEGEEERISRREYSEGGSGCLEVPGMLFQSRAGLVIPAGLVLMRSRK